MVNKKKEGKKKRKIEKKDHFDEYYRLEFRMSKEIQRLAKKRRLGYIS
jgi:hypothetical protein